ncbi:MAG: type II secretion system protein [Gammaproteobacteria bacterium]|nr:type II secretion system protein [Gammaproteobacteria bacterium]
MKFKKSIGFTLIELVIVIAIIGILAAVAIPKFLNLSGNAQGAATTAIAGALAAANANNYASRKLSSTIGSAVTNCTDVAATLQGGALPAGYTIASTTAAADTTVTCTLNGPNSTTASFSATGIP